MSQSRPTTPPRRDYREPGEPRLTEEESRRVRSMVQDMTDAEFAAIPEG